MEGHKERLLSLCRVCGMEIKTSHVAGKLTDSLKKINFVDEIHHLYNIDVSEENNDIYPIYICHNHVTLLRRYRITLTKGKTFSTSVRLAEFTEHTEFACKLCFVTITDGGHDYLTFDNKTSVGRPAKRKRTVLSESDKIVINYKDNNDDDSVVDDMDGQLIDDLLYQFQKLSDRQRQEFIKRLIPMLCSGEDILTAGQLGSKYADSLAKEANAASSVYRDMNLLLDLDIREYVEGRNPVLLSFLLNMSKKTTLICEDKELCVLGRSIENIYKLIDTKNISPLSFLNNITTYMDCGSRKVIDINGSTGPSGKYGSICNWMAEQAAVGPPIPPTGDIAVAFDNDQVVGKRWGIVPGQKLQKSVITNKAYFQLAEDGTLQRDSNLKPGKWFNIIEDDITITNVRDELESLYSSSDEAHWEQCQLFIDCAIREVLSEQEKNENITDHVDDLVSKKRTASSMKKCPSCQTYINKGKKKCPFCAELVTKTDKCTNVAANTADEASLQEHRTPETSRVQREKITEYNIEPKGN